MPSHSCVGPQNNEPKCPCAMAAMNETSSFTNQERRIATERDCAASWAGEPNGKRFRCYLCGHRFVPGDGWRWVSGSGTVVEDDVLYGVPSFLVCDRCDGDDVTDKWVARNQEFLSDKFWALR